MGAAASVNGNDDLTFISNQCVTDFPKFGVKLSFYKQFIELCGGSDSLKGMTTTDVCEHFLKPMTAQYMCSYCELLHMKGHEALGIAEVFISHAWKYQFLGPAATFKTVHSLSTTSKLLGFYWAYSKNSVEYIEASCKIWKWKRETKILVNLQCRHFRSCIAPQIVMVTMTKTKLTQRKMVLHCLNLRRKFLINVENRSITIAHFYSEQ